MTVDSNMNGGSRSATAPEASECRKDNALAHSNRPPTPVSPGSKAGRSPAAGRSPGSKPVVERARRCCTCCYNSKLGSKFATKCDSFFTMDKLRRFFPIITWLPKYQLAFVKNDIVGGLTVGLTLVPQAIAYAQLAQVPPEYGLYSAFLSLFIYGLMGTSKDASLGPTAILALMVGASITESQQDPEIMEYGDEIERVWPLVMCFFSGLVMVVLGLIQFGFLVDLFSMPVIQGFSTAAALAIMCSQFKSLLGIPNVEPAFIGQMRHYIVNLDQTKVPDLLMGLGCMFVLIFLQIAPALWYSFGHHLLCSREERAKVEEEHQMERQRRQSYMPPDNKTRNRKSQASANSLQSGRPGTTSVADKKNGNSVSNGRLEETAPEPAPTRDSKVDRENLRGNALITSVIGFISISRNVIVVVVTMILGFLHHTDWGFDITGKIPAGFPTPVIPAFGGVYKDQLVFEGTGANATNTTKSVLIIPFSKIMEHTQVDWLLLPILAALELFAVAKSLGKVNKYHVDASQELLTVGICNVVNAFFLGMPITAAVTRSAVNSQCGVKTNVAGMISGLIVVVAMGVLMPIMMYIPKAALAAIIIHAAINMIQVRAIYDLWTGSKRDFFFFFLTFALCIAWNLAFGIIIGMVVCLLTFLHPVARVKVKVAPHDVGKGTGKHRYVSVIHINQGLQFLSVDHFIYQMHSIVQKHKEPLVLDCTYISEIDFSGYQGLREFLMEVAVSKNTLAFAHLKPELQHHVEKVLHLKANHFKFYDNLTRAIEELARLRYDTDDKTRREMERTDTEFIDMQKSLQRRQSFFQYAGTDIALGGTGLVMHEDDEDNDVEEDFNDEVADDKIAHLGLFRCSSDSNLTAPSGHLDLSAYSSHKTQPNFRRTYSTDEAKPAASSSKNVQFSGEQKKSRSLSITGVLGLKKDKGPTPAQLKQMKAMADKAKKNQSNKTIIVEEDEEEEDSSSSGSMTPPPAGGRARQTIADTDVMAHLWTLARAHGIKPDTPSCSSAASSQRDLREGAPSPTAPPPIGTPPTATPGDLEGVDNAAYIGSTGRIDEFEQEDFLVTQDLDSTVITMPPSSGAKR